MQQYVFKRHKVQAVLKQALRDRMEGQQYDPVKAAQVCTYPFCTESRLALRQAGVLVHAGETHSDCLVCSMQSS